MTKIKTLIESLQNGPEKAIESLDKKVEDLGDIRIKDIKDSIYPVGYTFQQSDSAYIERIVIYKDKTTIQDGQPWKPTLDTDLEEFMRCVKLPRDIKNDLDEVYAQDKKTIRELIAMPYEWLHYFGMKEKDWGKLQQILNQYDIKLYKKGNVIED